MLSFNVVNFVLSSFACFFFQYNFARYFYAIYNTQLREEFSLFVVMQFYRFSMFPMR